MQVFSKTWISAEVSLFLDFFMLGAKTSCFDFAFKILKGIPSWYLALGQPDKRKLSFT